VGDAVQGDAVQGDAVQGDAVQGDAVQGDAVQGDAVQGDAVQGDAVQGDAVQGADRIEREILVDAPIERVWRLVSEPGWWIGDGDRSAQDISRDGDLVTVDDPRYGRYLVLVVSADAPHHVSYRSSPLPGEPPAEGTSTLVEFVLAEQGGGTLVRVVESGFASLAVPAERRAAMVEGNTAGWELQLGVAKRDAEHVRA
jgi:pentapeptide MXKDX repeat protein